MNEVTWAAAGLVVGVTVGMIWSSQWQRRFRYEAEHWLAVVKQHKELYQQEHMLVKSLRQELVQLHERITKLTVREIEVLEWVSRNVKRAKEENEKLQLSSLEDSADSGSKPKGT